MSGEQEKDSANWEEEEGRGGGSGIPWLPAGAAAESPHPSSPAHPPVLPSSLSSASSPALRRSCFSPVQVEEDKEEVEGVGERGQAGMFGSMGEAEGGVWPEEAGAGPDAARVGPEAAGAGTGDEAGFGETDLPLCALS